ncbi:MAG: DNA-deoxyinosine glycosylase [Acidobacteriota bacterium]|nr:DNA-deoxyinosine glycosylase [Acidobacteriota bacterium]
MCLGFDPVSAKDARVLILGTLPGEESLAANEYYANKRNAFWWIMGELIGAHPDLPYQSRLDLLRKKGIALWDVCKSAERQGSLDAKIIKNTVETNDFDSFLREHAQVKAIIFNGHDAEKLFRRSQYASSTWVSRVEKHTLDSTSPTNTIKKTEKLRRWRDSLATYL